MIVILASSSVDGITTAVTQADEVVVAGERIVRPASATVLVVV